MSGESPETLEAGPKKPIRREIKPSAREKSIEFVKKFPFRRLSLNDLAWLAIVFAKQFLPDRS